MARFVRFLRNEEEGPLWGLVNNDDKFLEIEGDRFTRYNVTDREINPKDVRILPPCVPGKIVCVGLNYAGHAKELNMELPKEPLFFIKTPNTVIGHKDKIKMPEISARVDYEAELAIIIKNDIKNIDEDEVEKNVLGYTCFNDVTARDIQKADGQWSRAKCFDTFGPMGPYFTRKINPDNVEIKLLLNGEEKQGSNTSDFIFKTGFLVSYISKMMTLNRGDVITTGTPPGIGSLSKGDRVEVEIEGIGKLLNYVE
ncbi:MAG TPA: FAA hydrolase family protein [Firmicutes bacterium]|nr:FAA hydrolase family protein [Bacillota bacterium]